MNGIIVIDKPINMTSHDVVSQVRKTLKTKKVGHLGTLDPLASGVLVVCVGDATKLAQFIENVEKTYLATICIGKTTSTLDSESDFTEKKKVEKIDENTILSVLDSFLGKSLQYPPIFSAIKVNGRKLYDLARKGEEIQIPKNYFPDDNPDLRPVMRWRGSANIVFGNWLNYCVYQDTPFNINDINK